MKKGLKKLVFPDDAIIMKYIWQDKQWPNFEYEISSIQDILYQYAIATGLLSNDLKHLPEDLQVDAAIDVMVAEAIKTSEIEGENLNYEDVRSSIRNQLGLSEKPRLIKDPRAEGIAHLYFECIHPFDDGNGRIGRAISEKALSQELEKPILFSLSDAIQKNKKEYYQELGIASKNGMNITRWIEYFVRTIYSSLLDSKTQVHAIMQKSQFWNTYASKLNERQALVLARMFKEGIGGFKGGINTQKYMKIAHCSKATATRDLAELLKLGCIGRLPGGGRNTSYQIKLPDNKQ